MTHKSPFNDYDADGYRMTITGCRSHLTEDENLLGNLRFAHPQLEDISDAELINLYDCFALSEYFGDNDARFVEYVREMQ